MSYPVVYVSTILAYPFTLPIFGVDILYFLLSFGLLIAEHHIQLTRLISRKNLTGTLGGWRH